jgi:hypothetical protein
VCGGRGEEDAVAVVPGGDEVVRTVGKGAEQRKAVRSCGAKAGPGFELWGIGQRRK